MTETDAWLLGVHLWATAAMMGLIWFVQLVHYPLFAEVGRSRFVGYEHQHTRRTSWVVGPLMAIEGVAAVTLFVWPAAELGRALPFVAGLVLVLVHLSTVMLQVPAHRRLASGFDAEIHHRLVATNWIRTAGWTTRAGLATAMLAAA
ncbi:MAG: hypothetical protein ACR2OH_05585 [Microthrixaceae bacterium]